MKSLVCAALMLMGLVGVVVGPLPAHAELIGSIDEPASVGSGIGTIRGWVYSTTGATVISPMTVFVDDNPVATVVCCTSRSDVPVRLSGFAAQFNWSLLTPGVHEMRIAIASSSGEVLSLSRRFSSVRTADVTFATKVRHSETTQCFFSNSSDQNGPARFRCTDLIVTTVSGEQQCHGSIAFEWDIGSQSFKQVTGCN